MRQVFITSECVNKSISQSIFNACCYNTMRSGNGCKHVCEISSQPRLKWLNQVKYFAKANGTFAVSYMYQLQTVSLFSNRDSKVAKKNIYHLCRPHLPSSCLLLPRPDSIGLYDRIERSPPPFYRTLQRLNITQR